MDLTSEKPHQAILNRETPTEHIKKHFRGQVKLLQEIVDYGSI